MRASSDAARTGAVDEDPAVAGYRQWSLVNPQPVLMEAVVASECAGATFAGKPKVDPRAEGPGPHDKFISVYVNDVGRPIMFGVSPSKYARGSMIVKEKLHTQESRTPELLTAMIKRERGYNPAGGDWEYLVLDGDARHVSERGKLASCMRCHAGAADDDSVFRGYQPR